MGLILCIETSSSVCSVCLAKNGLVVSVKEDTTHNAHARMLTVLIDKLLMEAGCKFQQLDAIAVSAGPGSYTGLRIGVSVAKGLCYALGKPLISVSTLQIILEEMLQAKSSTISYCLATIEAKRNQIYYSLFDTERTELLPTTFVELTAEFEKLLPAEAEILVGGSGTEICKLHFNNSRFQFSPKVFPNAIAMAKGAEEKFRNLQLVDIAYFEPTYFQDFIPKKPKL